MTKEDKKRMEQLAKDIDSMSDGPDEKTINNLVNPVRSTRIDSHGNPVDPKLTAAFLMAEQETKRRNKVMDKLTGKK